MENMCVLCGEALVKYPVNREHFIPQVLIREFDKLCIPDAFQWVERSLNYGSTNESDSIITKRSDHKRWAVVKVHEKCNLEASAMCRDLRYIIDHMDQQIPSKYFYRPIEYYAGLWRVPIEQVSFTLLTADEARKRRDDDFMVLYYPGLLNCGRIMIASDKDFINQRVMERNDYEWHTITIGTSDAIR
jgi:hypothetical protein